MFVLIEELSKKPLTAEKKDRLCRPEILLPIDTITSRIFLIAECDHPVP